MIIAIYGKMRSGKDTITGMLQELFLRRDLDLKHLKLSEPLYEELQLFCEKYGLKYTKNRRFLEGVGQLLNENYERGDKLIELFDDKYYRTTNYIVSDMRRLTQYDYFKDKRAYLIKITADENIRKMRCIDEQEFATDHVTDNELDNSIYDYYLKNNGSLYDLKNDCQKIVEDIIFYGEKR